MNLEVSANYKLHVEFYFCALLLIRVLMIVNISLPKISTSSVSSCGFLMDTKLGMLSIVPNCHIYDNNIPRCNI